MKAKDKNITRRTSIAGIETLIVDSHNEVLPLWYEKKNGKPFALTHVDSHNDMHCSLGSFYSQISLFKTKSLKDYSKTLGCGEFISGAVYDEIIGSVVHILPRNKFIRLFNKIEDKDSLSSPEINKDFLGLKWKYKDQKNAHIPSYKIISEDKLSNLLKNRENPFILDIDLDAFHLYKEDNLNLDFSDRISYTENILRKIQKPEAITIARSQTPVFIDSRIVDLVEVSCINMLKRLYK
jgi:hypothetical protein